MKNGAWKRSKLRQWRRLQAASAPCVETVKILHLVVVNMPAVVFLCTSRGLGDGDLQLKRGENNRNNIENIVGLPRKKSSRKSQTSRLHKCRKPARGLHAGCTAEAAAVSTRLSPLRQHFPSLLLLPVFTETFASKPSAPRSLPSPPSPALIPTLSILWKVRRRRQGRGDGDCCRWHKY